MQRYIIIGTGCHVLLYIFSKFGMAWGYLERFTTLLF